MDDTTLGFLMTLGATGVLLYALVGMAYIGLKDIVRGDFSAFVRNDWPEVILTTIALITLTLFFAGLSILPRMWEAPVYIFRYKLPFGLACFIASGVFLALAGYISSKRRRS